MIHIEPAFIQGADGRVFTVYYAAQPKTDRPAVLYLPPFAEEMNRSRRVSALLARRLAGDGFPALLLDPYGTGDSAGDFREARWSTWRGDVLAAVDHLRRRGHDRIIGIGLRLGALLALDSGGGAVPFERVILWQPVLRGDQMVTQFLRLQLAGALIGKDGKATETTSRLRERLRNGDILEIAGYELSPELVAAIDALRLEELGKSCGAPIDWIAVEMASAAPSPVQQQIVETWQKRATAVRVHRVEAEPFWSLQETTLAPALVALTAELVAGRTA